MNENVHLGIDVGGTKIAAGLVTPEGRLLGESRIRSRPELEPPAMIEHLVDQITALAAERKIEVGRLAGVGLAVPGDVDPANGRLKTIPNLPRFVGTVPGELLRQALAQRGDGRLPVAVGNDAAAAALAEGRHGAARGAAPFLYLTVSTGVGGARGDGRRAVNLEPGLRLRPDPERPDASLESLAGGAALAARARAELAATVAAGVALGRRTRLFELVEVPGDTLAARLEHLTCQHLGKAANAGDLYSRGLLERAAGHVAAGVAQLLAEGHGDERVVIGGAIAENVVGYLDWMRAALERHPLPPGFDPARDFVAAELGSERGVLGAALFSAGAWEWRTPTDPLD